MEITRSAFAAASACFSREKTGLDCEITVRETKAKNTDRIDFCYSARRYAQKSSINEAPPEAEKKENPSPLEKEIEKILSDIEAKKSKKAECAAASAAEKNTSDETKDSIRETLEKQSEKIRSFFGGTDEDKERQKLSGIRAKINGGQKLTPAEKAYLEQKDPDSYSNYQQIERASAMYRSMLKCCQTRDQVIAMRLSNSLSAYSEFRRSGKNGGSPIAGMHAAMERELQDYMKSSGFKRLPTTAECNKFDKDLANARKYEREKQAAKREEMLAKRKKDRDKLRKLRLKKTLGDGKRTVAQVMSSPNARKVLASRRSNSGCYAAIDVTKVFKLNTKA